MWGFHGATRSEIPAPMICSVLIAFCVSSILEERVVQLLTKTAIAIYLGKCNKLIDLIVGNILGAGIGVAYFFLFWASGNKNLLFGNSLDSNNVICNRPAKQTFKCAVYKNGQVVKNL